MNILYIFPFFMFAYLIYTLRYTPLWLASIPLFLSLGEAGFMHAWGFSITFPFIGIPLNWKDLTVFSLVIAWYYAQLHYCIVCRKPRDIGIKLTKTYLLLNSFFVPLAWFQDMMITPGTIIAIRNIAYFPISALLWICILRRCNRLHIHVLLKSLTTITIIGSVLYCLSSVGLPVFPYTGWESGRGFGTITRDFLTYPPYAGFALGYLLFFQKRRLYRNIGLMLLLSATLLSYTRSIILAFVISAFSALILYRKRSLKDIMRILYIPIILIFSFMILRMLAPTNIEFLTSRLTETSVEPDILPYNLRIRFMAIETISQEIENVSKLFGAGYSRTFSTSYTDLDIQIVMGDILWGVILFRQGISGIIVLSLLLLTYLLMTVKMLRNDQMDNKQLAGVCYIIIVWQILRTVASAELLWYPIINGLIIAVISIEYVSAKLITRQIEFNND